MLCAYINLDSRRDRLTHIRQQIQKLPVRSLRIPGEPGGARGCTRSHIKALQRLRALGQHESDTYVMVLEDDFVVVDSNWGVVTTALQNAPDVLMLTCQLRKHQGCRVLRGLNSAGYVVKKQYIPQLIRNMMDSLTLDRPLDVHWQVLQRRDKWHFLQGFGTQMESFSDIEGRVTNYQAILS
jgi:hypothetical protein